MKTDRGPLEQEAKYKVGKHIRFPHGWSDCTYVITAVDTEYMVAIESIDAQVW